MKLFVVFFMVLAVVGCKTVKEKEPELLSFACEMPIDDFSKKLGEIASFGGFEKVDEDVADSNYLAVLEKTVSRKGSGETLVIIKDQIRFRYSEIEKTVWVTHGIKTQTSKSRKFKAPQKSDEVRHKESVTLTIDRIFMQCNPGQFPNRI